MRELMTDIQLDKRPALPSGMHPVLRSIVERGWKADPDERPTMAEICTELSEVDWLVFGGAGAGRVKREATGLPLSQSVSKAMVHTLLSETQARVRLLERANSKLKWENGDPEVESEPEGSDNCGSRVGKRGAEVGELDSEIGGLTAEGRARVFSCCEVGRR
jgi:hypothetical protein